MQKRILFFRSGAIGDIIHCLPAIKLARKENPEAIIELVIATTALKDLLDISCPYIDKIYSVRKKIYESQDLLASIKDKPVTDFIFLHSHWWRGANWNARFIHARNYYQYKKDIRLTAVENYAVTFFPELKDSMLSAHQEDSNQAWFKHLDYKTLLMDTSENQEDDYICVAIGVGKLRPTRSYPVSLWKSFIKEVLTKTDLKVKLLGGKDERRLNEYLTLSLEGALIADYGLDKARLLLKRLESIVAKTDLVGLAKTLKGSKQVFSGDTGILHIASALDTNVSSMFSISSEWRTGPFHPSAQVFRAANCLCNPDNSNSKKHCSNLKNGYAACLWKLKPEEIFASLDRCKSPTSVVTLTP